MVLISTKKDPNKSENNAIAKKEIRGFSRRRVLPVFLFLKNQIRTMRLEATSITGTLMELVT